MLKKSIITIFSILIIAPSAAHSQVVPPNPTPNVVTFPIWTPEPNEAPHHCSPAGSFQGPYKPGQARSTKTKEAFEKAAKNACIYFWMDARCKGPKFPTGDLPQYMIVCSGPNTQASAVMNISLSKKDCRCPEANSTGGKAYMPEQSQTFEDSYTLEEIVEAISEPAQ